MSLPIIGFFEGFKDQGLEAGVHEWCVPVVWLSRFRCQMPTLVHYIEYGIND